MLNHLRPYQSQVGKAILDSVLGRKGLTFSVEISRQGGKTLYELFEERGFQDLITDGKEWTDATRNPTPEMAPAERSAKNKSPR